MSDKEQKLRNVKKKYIDSMIDLGIMCIESYDEAFWELISASDERDEEYERRKERFNKRTYR